MIERLVSPSFRVLKTSVTLVPKSNHCSADNRDESKDTHTRRLVKERGQSESGCTLRKEAAWCSRRWNLRHVGMFAGCIGTANAVRGSESILLPTGLGMAPPGVAEMLFHLRPAMSDAPPTTPGQQRNHATHNQSDTGRFRHHRASREHHFTKGEVKTPIVREDVETHEGSSASK